MNIWSLTRNQVAVAAHLVTDPSAPSHGSRSMLMPVPRPYLPEKDPGNEGHGSTQASCLGQSKNKLMLSAAIVFVFIIAQFIGGYFANSLAIMMDTANLFLEFTSFMVGILAVLVATRLPSKRLTFGWHRAEVLAAVVSVILIWLLAALVLYEAIQRVIHTNYNINADIMLITAAFGLLVNILLFSVLRIKNDTPHDIHTRTLYVDERRSKNGDSTVNSLNGKHLTRAPRSDTSSTRPKIGSQRNINVSVGLMFVINDLIQSIGVLVSAYIIKFKPEWKLADPLCTFVFCTMVVASSSKVIYDALVVMMEAAPRHVDYDEIMRGLKSLEGVRGVHSLNIWSLTLNQVAVAAHLVTEPSVFHQQILYDASLFLTREHMAGHITIQLEEHDVTMEYCDKCKNRIP
ncbi:hypothetical protein EMCRGX_G004795 [Ephydatia muelleri]